MSPTLMETRTLAGLRSTTTEGCFFFSPCALPIALVFFLGMCLPFFMSEGQFIHMT
jgi:hypothetical protein